MSHPNNFLPGATCNAGLNELGWCPICGYQENPPVRRVEEVPKTDTERLDWLEKQNWYAWGNESGGQFVIPAYDDSIREAIDRAMEARLRDAPPPALEGEST